MDSGDGNSLFKYRFGIGAGLNTVIAKELSSTDSGWVKNYLMPGFEIALVNTFELNPNLALSLNVVYEFKWLKYSAKIKGIEVRDAYGNVDYYTNVNLYSEYFENVIKIPLSISYRFDTINALIPGLIAGFGIERMIYQSFNNGSFLVTMDDTYYDENEGQGIPENQHSFYYLIGADWVLNKDMQIRLLLESRFVTFFWSAENQSNDKEYNISVDYVYYLF